MRATKAVQKILSNYEGETPGVKANLCRMMMEGIAHLKAIKGNWENAICLVSVDEAISDKVLAEVKALPQVIRANRLEF